MTGTISKLLRQHLSNITDKHEIKELQKNSHIGHCTHTAESANVKVQNIFHVRNNITLAQPVNTEQLQHHMPQKHVCFRYVTVNTLHKGDNKNNNNNNTYLLTYSMVQSPS